MRVTTAPRFWLATVTQAIIDEGMAPEFNGQPAHVVEVSNPKHTTQRPTFGAYGQRCERDHYVLVVAPYLMKAGLGEPGLQQLDAMRAVTRTAEYEQLVETMRSFRIHVASAETNL